MNDSLLTSQLYRRSWGVWITAGMNRKQPLSVPISIREALTGKYELGFMHTKQFYSWNILSKVQYLLQNLFIKTFSHYAMAVMELNEQHQISRDFFSLVSNFIFLIVYSCFENDTIYLFWMKWHKNVVWIISRISICVCMC